MRRRIVLVVVATTSLVVVAFAIPLGALVQSVARDRAISAAERDVASLSPTLAVAGSTPELIATALDSTGTGADGRMAVWLPDGTVVGEPGSDADPEALRLAREQGQAFIRPRWAGTWTCTRRWSRARAGRRWCGRGFPSACSTRA